MIGGLRLFRSSGGHGRKLASMYAMNEPIPGLVSDGGDPGLSRSSSGAKTQISRLENGLRVASQEAYGQYSTVGG